MTKPIAYRLFADLPDLLVQMQREIIAGYESAITAALQDAGASGLTQDEVLETLVSTYVDYSLGGGAVYDTVSAALAATAAAEQPPFELPDSYLALARDLFALPAGQETAVVAMFLGAADSLTAAVQTGLVSRRDAVAHLVGLFASLRLFRGQP